MSEASDQADTWNAVATGSQATSGKPSPIASCGAKPIEWTTPSRVASAPSSARSRSASVDRCSVLVTSSSMTAASCGSRLATRLHSDRVRPKFDSTTVAPCSCAMRAVA